MESEIPSRSERDTPPGALQRLLLAVMAACVLGALGWAAVQVQEAKAEVRGLKEDLVVAQRNERAASAAERAVPVVDLSSKVADLERRLTETGKAAAAKEKELTEVIAFLRKENTAAQETIQRLSAPPPEPVPEIAPLPEPPAIPAKPPRRRGR